MLVTDYNRIKEVTFKVPELMQENAKEEVINLFNSIEDLKDKISELRMEATRLEKPLKEMEDKWYSLLPLIDIEFKTEEIDEVRNITNISFNFSADINKKIH